MYYKLLRIFGALLLNIHCALSTNACASALNPYEENINIKLSIEQYNLAQLSNKNYLNISFCSAAEAQYCVPPARNMQVNGQKITKGITIEPAIEGEWRFHDYNNGVQFSPKKPWKAGESYKVTIDKSVLPYFIALVNNSINFFTQPLLCNIEEMVYMQDPINLDKKFVQTKINFNYPVDTKSFEEKYIFVSDNASDKYTTSVSYSEDKTKINLVTTIKELIKDERVLKLTITEGLKPLFGGESLNYAKINAINNKPQYYGQKVSTTQQVVIPSIYSYFKISQISLQNIKNAQYVPEQVLIVQTNAPVTSAELSDHLELLLLPKDKSSAFIGGFNKKNYNWQSTEEITKDIEQQSAQVPFKIIPGDVSYSTINSFKLEIPGGSHLLLKFKKGIRSKGDFILGKDYRQVIAVPEFPIEIKIMSDGSILSLSGDKKLSIYSLGVDQLSIEVDKVSPDDINHLISQTYEGGKFQNPIFKNWSFNKYNISKVFEEKISLKNQDNKTPQYSTFDFSKYINKKVLSSDDTKGLFFIKVAKKDDKNKEIVADERFIVITDLGFLVKTNQDGSQNIFVSSIKKGEPIKGAKVELIGLNGQVIVSAETDVYGHAVLPDVRDYNKEKTPTAYVIKSGKDLSFMPYGRVDREINYSKFETSGVISSRSGLKAYLFSDRGIYRPGETGNIGIILKQAGWQGAFAGLPLELEVINPRGQIVDKKKIIMNKEGFVEYNFTTHENSPTGIYNIILNIAKDSDSSGKLGNAVVRVEDFLPDKMKIKSSFGQNANKLWVNSAHLTALINLDNLYGTPAVDRRVTGTIDLVPSEFSVPSLSDYTFFSGRKSDKNFIEILNELKTDEKGRAEFDLNLEKFSDATYRLNFYAEGFEPDSGRSVKTINSILVSPLPYIIGFKANGDLDYINQQDEKEIGFIAIDSDGNKIAAANLNLELKKINFVNALTIQQNGTYAYQSVPIESPLSSVTIDINNQGYIYKLPTKDVGDYILRLIGPNNVIFTETKFSVVGEGNVGANLTKTTGLKIKTNKKDFKANEEIELNIISPYTGYGLITIETDKVHSFAWFKAQTTNSLQKIKIPSDFEGKGYLTVQFIRDLNSKEIYISPFSYASLPFTANIEKRDQKIALTVPSQTKPGEELAVKYSTKQPGKIVIYAIDEGILLFGKYKLPDPISYFIKDRALEVATTHILDLILPEHSILKMYSQIGGDDFTPDGKNLNPFKRKSQPPVVFWSGIIDSDRLVKEITFKIPEYFNGSLKVMAISVSESALGNATTNVTVQGDFVINPNLPLFIAPQDEFITPVSIANNLTGSGSSKIKLTVTASEHLELIDFPKEVEIPKGKDKSINISLRAHDILGSGALTISAEAEGAIAEITSTVSVRPPSPSSTTIVSGYSDKREIGFDSTRSLYKEFGKMITSTSSMPVGIVRGLYEYLGNYEYGCTEQLVSKNFPNIILYDQPDLLSSLVIDQKKLHEALSRIFGSLRERQNFQGGFGMWSNFEETDDFVSIYTMHFFTEAADKNLPVPEDAFRLGLEYLKNMSNKSINSLQDARNKAYAIYVLTRNNEISTIYLANVLSYLETNYADSWRDDLAAVYIAASYKMLHMTAEADALIKRFNAARASASDASKEYNFYSKFIKYSQYLYIMSLHFPKELKLLDPSLLQVIAQSVSEAQYNTLSSSYAIMAMVAYTNVTKDAPVTEFKLQAFDPVSKKSQELYLKGKRIKTASIPSDSKDIKLSASIANFYYQITTSGFDKISDNIATTHGLELERKYLDELGKEVTTVSLGDTINVVMTFRSGSSREINNVAIVDLLPGGFELAPDAIKEYGEQWSPDYVDRREDRVIVFGSIPNYGVTYRYKIKAVNIGTFTTPPSYGEAMYLPDVYSKGVAGSITIIY